MNLLFLGSGAFGLPTLQALARTHAIRAIVSQPDRPAGRGGHITPTPIADWAAQHLPTVPLLKPEKVNDPSVIAQLREYDADAWVVIAFGQKLGKALLADRFAVNLHASLLPRWRGAAPINAAILAGDTATGNSVITLADKMDAGLILAQSRRDITPSVTAGELHDLLAADGPSLVEDVLARHAANKLTPRAQDESLVTIAPKLSKEDGRIDFTQDADTCRRRIHALNPWPTVTTWFRGEPLKLLRAASSATSTAPNTSTLGTLVDPDTGGIICGQNSTLTLLEVQPAGKRPMPWPAFAHGRSPKLGEQLLPVAGGNQRVE